MSDTNLTQSAEEKRRRRVVLMRGRNTMVPPLAQTISAARLMLKHARLSDEQREKMRAFVKTAEAVEAQRPDSWFRREMARLRLLADGVSA